MRPRALIAALACALACASPAAAALPSDLSADPLDRGVLLALPSVYRVDVVVRVDALRLADGSRYALRPRARVIEELGTAVAVAPGGWLVTARHVAAPDDATIARLAYQSDLAARGLDHSDEEGAIAWVEENGAVPIRPSVGVTVSQARAGAEGDPRPVPVVSVEASNASDLALIQIRAPKAPSLALEEGASAGTPVATIGFGTGSALDTAVPEADRPIGEPAVRRGRIAAVGTLEEETPKRRALAIAVPVVQGDSGGPVVDRDGAVRGIVTLRSPRGGIAELATEVRLLLVDHGVMPGPDASADLFREGMGAFWALDFPLAEQRFASVVESAYPAHALAGAERVRAASLATGDFTLAGQRRRGGLLAVGILAAVAALVCAVALALPVLSRGRRGTTAR